MKGLAVVFLVAAFAMGGSLPGDSAGHRAEHRYAARLAGGGQMGCLDALWTQESNWDPYAVNPKSGAYGIPQALPSVWGHPYAAGDWRAQIRWGLGYIGRRYGSPCAAWSAWQAKGWY